MQKHGEAKLATPGHVAHSWLLCTKITDPVAGFQDMRERQEHFQHKQRVLQEATAKANVQAALRNRTALAACLTVWRHVSGVYKVLAARLAALQRHSLAGAMQHWHAYAHSRVDSMTLRAHSVPHQMSCDQSRFHLHITSNTIAFLQANCCIMCACKQGI